MQNVLDVARWRLCVGCGACVYACPGGHLEMQDVPQEGLRPRQVKDGCAACPRCLSVCPGVNTDHRPLARRSGLQGEWFHLCGPVLEIWEGHAVDPEIRFRASSGGCLTALALHALEQEGYHGVLHIGSEPGQPLRNRAGLSRSRAELLERCGSRYAPAAPAEKLAWMAAAPAPCVFIGKPCDVTALRKAGELEDALRLRTGLALAFFCAGTPSTLGTLDLLARQGANPLSLKSLHYRGHGWPGQFTAETSGGGARSVALSYEESWGFLQAYRPYRCHLCPDGTGEDADISCGDAWYQKPDGTNPGSSILIVRTERGRAALAAAIRAGYIEARPAQAEQLLQSQRNLLAKRRSVGGRLTALRLLRIPCPELKGFALGRNWLALPLREKIRSVAGTLRRALKRGYRRPM